MPSRPVDLAQRHLEEILPEREFVPRLSRAARSVLLLGRYLSTTPSSAWPKKVFANLSQESDELESYLDDFGARWNRVFATFTEFVASIRWFARGGHTLSHIEGRFPHYEIEVPHSERAEFLEDLALARAFCGKALVDLLSGLLSEAARVGCALPQDGIDEKGIPEEPARRRLPRNLDEGEIVEEEHKVAEVASKYLKALDRFRGLNLRRAGESIDLRRFVENHCTEECARLYEATVHNIQSKYDTYLRATASEARDPRLRKMRGHASVALHLLGFVTDLVHFYERHETDIRSEGARERIAALIDKVGVLHQSVHFGLFHAVRFLERGRPFAEAVLPQYTKMQTYQAVLPEGVYLHARPASLIVSVVNHYGTPVEMEIGGKRCNAGSILQVMILAGSNAGARQVLFHGDERPLRDLRRLFDLRLGEGGLKDLPDELGYLRN